MSKNAKWMFARFLLVNGLFCLSHAFAYTVYVRFLIWRGMDLFQCGLINLAFMVGVFALEIPTGALADLFGRKVSSLMGFLLYAVGYLYYFGAYTFGGFIFAELLTAGGKTFTSGAFDAWMIDAIRKEGYDGRLEMIHARAKQVDTACTLLGASTGAIISRNDLSLVWLFGGTGLLLVGLLAFAILPADNGKNIKISFCTGITAFREQIRVGVAYCFRNKSIFWVIVICLGIAMLVQPLNMYWTVYVDNNTKDKLIYSWMWALISVAIIVGNQLARILAGRGIFEARVIRWCLLSVGVILASLLLWNNFWFVLAIFILQEIPRGVFWPCAQAYVNHRIPSADRATILSFVSMAEHIGAAVGLLVFGLTAKYLGIVNTWVIVGALFLALVPLARKINGHHEPRK